MVRAFDDLITGIVHEIRVIALTAQHRIRTGPTVQPVIIGIAHQQVTPAPAGEGIDPTATQHERTTVVGIRRRHAVRPRLHIPVAKRGQQRQHPLTLAVGKGIGVDVALKMQIVALRSLELGRHVGSIELNAAAADARCGKVGKQLLVRVRGVGGVLVVHLHRKGREGVADKPGESCRIVGHRHSAILRQFPQIRGEAGHHRICRLVLDQTLKKVSFRYIFCAS